MSKFGGVEFARSQYVLMYSPDDTNVYGGEFEGIGSVVASCKSLFLFTCSNLLFSHNAQRHRQTDRHDANSRSYCMEQYDRLKRITILETSDIKLNSLHITKTTNYGTQ